MHVASRPQPFKPRRANTKLVVQQASAFARAGGNFGWYASAISDAWEQAAGAIVNCGELLVNAKKDLPHGQWKKMVDKRLPFGIRTAQKLMVIAQDARIKTTPESLLPANVAVLYELTSLSDPDWKKARKSRQIHPEMKTRDAWNLTRKAKAQERATKAAEQNIPNDVSLWLADPPWETSYALPYKSLSLDRIKALRLRPDGQASTDLKDPTVAERSAQSAALGLWAVDELLHEAEEVMKAWGFKLLLPRIIWDKQTLGHKGRAGVRYAHEYLLIGVKGAAEPTPTKRLDSVVSIPRDTVHSAKPEYFHHMLAEMFPLFVERVELFARRQPPTGWRGWGNQYPGDTAQTRAA